MYKRISTFIVLALAAQGFAAPQPQSSGTLASCPSGFQCCGPLLPGLNASGVCRSTTELCIR
ncbi:hypothetical protein BDN72DRAFT_846290 [Pluteus cervinus]|uniref:Uncharacterized protein n=1 Tax=Pluteus cervinus TaxID=181527 RepID=A0ACD3AGA1_9AGAR|nr:hypothetical protein BDN72DRAFT_846290 [Pluteus cervinus]